jgi:predicted SprT family Zn-dependent metalloprotease
VSQCPVLLEDAKTMALQTMARHGLEGWAFDFDGARRRLGACWPQRRRITLSRHFVTLNSPDLVRDVILHEIAHALTPGAGHGPVFKRKARELGCNPNACVRSSELIPAPARFTLRCPHCGRSWPRYRRPKGRLACGSCLRDAGGQLLPLEVQTVR